MSTNPQYVFGDEEERKRREAALLAVQARAPIGDVAPIAEQQAEPTQPTAPTRPTVTQARPLPANLPPKRREEFDPDFFDYLGGFLANGVNGVVDIGSRARQSRNRTATQEQEYQQWLREQTEREAHNRTMEAVNPLAQERGDLAKLRFEAQEKERHRLADLRDINSETTRAHQDAAIAMGMPEEHARGMTGEQILQWRPQIGRQAVQVASNEEWRKREQMRRDSTAIAQGRSHDMSIERMGYGDELAQGREERGEQRERAKEKRSHAVAFVKADADMEVLEAKLRSLIEKKGADYKLPTRGNMLQRFWTSADKSVFGGSGMDWEDTDLVSSLQSSALPDYILVANNSPNTEPERETAFMKWFSDGSLGGMLRFVQQQRAQNAKRLQAIDELLVPEAPHAKRPARAQRTQAKQPQQQAPTLSLDDLP